MRDLFNLSFPKKKITKPIRLIELFAGYGSQALALRYLGVDFEPWKCSEWCVKSARAYNVLHVKDSSKPSAKKDDEEIYQFLEKKQISFNWETPMSPAKIRAFTPKRARQIYDDFINSNNLGSITTIHGRDLEVKDTEKFEYVVTYSFPCQDLSAAGYRAGMQAGSGTRSSLLWEVGRLLDEVDELPQILLMENVPQILAEGNIKEFSRWLTFLNTKGYQNYVTTLSPVHFGIPQTRKRCYCISILGDFYYQFPKNQKEVFNLSSFLDKKEDIPANYYISPKLLNTLFYPNFFTGYPRPAISLRGVQGAQARTLMTSQPNNLSTFLFEGHPLGEKFDNFDDFDAKIKAGYKLRTLTMNERLKLMGVRKDDRQKLLKNINKTTLTHLTGDAIVVNVLMAIFNKFFNDNELNFNNYEQK